jgi:hypothetical protein
MTSSSFWRKTIKLVPALKTAPKTREMIKTTAGKPSRIEYQVDPDDFKTSMQKKLKVDLKYYSYLDMFEENDFDSI